MPRKLSSAVLRPDLAAVAYEYELEASQRGFVADIVLPVFDTVEQNGEFPVIPSEAFLKLFKTKRAPRTKYGRSDYEFTSDDFACKEQGWEELVDDVEARLYARYFQAEEVSTLRAMDIILRSREKRVAELIQNDTNLPHGPVNIPWSDLKAANPRADVIAASKLVKRATGISPNALVITEDVFDNLVQTKAFLDHVQFTDPILAKDEDYQKRILAAYLKVPRVIVSDAIYDTGKKGQTTSTAGIWSPSYASLVRIATRPQDLREVCVGRTFLWTGDSPDIVTVENYREENSRGSVIRARHNIDEKLMFAAAGYNLKIEETAAA